MKCYCPKCRADRRKRWLVLLVASVAILAAVAIAAVFSGCGTHVQLENSKRLMERADFEAARTAAPEFTRDALKTINQLEYELERK